MVTDEIAVAPGRIATTPESDRAIDANGALSGPGAPMTGKTGTLAIGQW